MAKKRKRKRQSKKQIQRRKRRIIRTGIVVIILITLLCIFSSTVVSLLSILGFHRVKQVDGIAIEERFITPNEYSRPQKKLKKVKGVVVHYTANPGSDAKANRDYFNNLSITHTTYASSHYVIGLDGTVIQCIPLNEIAYASNGRNDDTISIECCHPDDTGKFNDQTYDSLVKLVAWLCGKYNLDKEDVIRHYDVTGKNCPKYYVENEEAWLIFKEDVFSYIEQYGE